MAKRRDSSGGIAGRRGLVAAALLMLAAAAAGCGDGPICQAQVLVIIQSPVGLIGEDTNSVLPGVQTDVRIRSTVGGGVEVRLEVLDGGGAVLVTRTGTTDARGDLTLRDVDLPPGAARLRAAVDAGECGHDEDEVAIAVTAGEGCQLAIRQTPLDIDYYAPIRVLNRSIDPEPDSPNFQADLDIAADPGAQVELFVIAGDTGVETSAGTAAADASGQAHFALSLAQGRQALRAVCRSGALTRASLTTTVFVDTEAPSCALTAPAPGSTLTPGLDENGDLDDGLQITLLALIAGDDTAGEAATFAVTVDGVETVLAGSPVTASGVSSAQATFAPATVPASAQIRLTGRDHADNECEVVEPYPIVYDGCAIAVAAPTGTVTSDADGDPDNGAQVAVTLQVDPACAGQTVTSLCGLNDPAGPVAGDGSLTLVVDWCGAVPCDREASCTFSVTSPDGITTTAATTIHYDDQAPSVAVQIVQPALACGAEVTADVDLDPARDGVQVRVRVVSPLAASRTLEHTHVGGTDSFDAAADVTITLGQGLNELVGLASDAAGNTGRSATCPLRLSDIVVQFLPPASSGAVGADAGTVVGDQLTFPLCGRVSTADAEVAVSVDGGPDQPATVTGHDWCVTLTLAASPPSYAIVARAQADLLVGSATLILAVDLTAPDPIDDLVVIADTRRSLAARWTTPADAGSAVAGYVVKLATVPLTEANFDTTGEPVPGPVPGAPGTLATLAIEPVRTGQGYWVGVAPFDTAGNRAAAAIVGPVVPRFDQTAAILPPDTAGNASFGLVMARGKFNDDELWDVAVAAPTVDVGGVAGAGAVYVYFGTPAGLGDTPDVVIEGATELGAFGLGLTALRGSSATRDDLVIGEPYGDNVNGRVYVFHGGAGFTAGTYAASEADRQIGVHPVPSYFSGGGLGFSLAAADFDGDARQDLVIGVPAGGGGNGGVAVLYGGTASGPLVLLSDADASQLGGAVVHLLDDPSPELFDIFGNYVHNVGRTMGPTDRTDDLLITYDDRSAGDFQRARLYRGATVRPTTPGVHARPFTVGQDVLIVHPTTDPTTELGASAGSIADLNGDGARDLVIGLHRDGENLGRVLIVDGNTLGTGGVASTATPGVVITTIVPVAGESLLGAAIVNNSLAPGADVDGDGFEDLVITTQRDGRGTMLIWFGGAIPVGTVTSDTAQHVIEGPATFDGGITGFGGTSQAAIWAGDVNGDGLPDICWGDATGNGRDGSFVVLWDDGI
jgi:hypothetical protein